MMKYSILTKLTAFGALEVEDYEEQETYYENKYDEEQEKLKIFGYQDSNYDCHLIHFFDSAFYDDFTEEMTIREAIEFLALKEGADLVRWENGNIGYIGYYGSNLNGFEIIA